MERMQNFIGGQYKEPQSGKFLPSFDPSRGEVYAEVPDSNELDVIAAIQSAAQAFDKWSKTTTQERSQILLKVADLIERDLDRLAIAESRDQGKPLWLARKMDIPRSVANFRFFATRILHKQEMATDMDGEALNYVSRKPLGVVGLISPWNLPLYLLTWKIAPALAAGNTVVCKPSEFTSMTAYLLGEILNEAGLPPGVVNLVFGKGDPVGSTLCSHPAIAAISFTGSTATGESIQHAAAASFKKLSLELGGKNATIVLKDADLKKAVPEIIKASFLNQGEICLCGEKILVQQDIYEEFKQEFVKQTKELVVGDPMLEETFMGPLVSEAHWSKVKTLVGLAVKEKGKLLAGDEDLNLKSPFDKGYFLRPTIVEDLTHCSEIHQTEIFGPVVTLNSFKYPHEAVKWANTSPYGLSASLWTQDVSKAHKLSAALDV
ncbi:MAG: aldehyde dehydrogenase, partial [Bdellovibrionales bacterium]|nr:aldehyde dehydrogenase [Bdellovibrionales bacterium]